LFSPADDEQVQILRIRHTGKTGTLFNKEIIRTAIGRKLAPFPDDHRMHGKRPNKTISISGFRD
jgi:hypothetical protein